MMKLFDKWKETTKFRFKAAELKENDKNDSNPGRGWYRLYSFTIEEPVIYDELRVVCCKEEQLAMVQIDIGNYRDRPLDLTALENLKLILQFFQTEKKELILRILYDREGKGIEKEPSHIQLIQEHMKQAGAVLREYADIIFTLQGLFIGSWGEMHSSKFLSAECIKLLTATMYEAVAGTCRLAVRKPQYLRMLFADSELQQQEYVGLYNDGMLASESDLGTYGTQRREAANWQDSWCRQDELEFQNELCQQIPNGGEVVDGEWYHDIETVVRDMSQMHITYLHSVYDNRLLDKWRDSVYKGEGAFYGANGYEFIGAHLGYRFFLCAAYLEYKKKEAMLTIEVKNTGFANAYDKMEVYLLLVDSGKLLKKHLVQTDVSGWTSGKSSIMSISLGPLKDIKKSEVQIQIQRIKGKANIRLANEGAGDTFTLGYLYLA